MDIKTRKILSITGNFHPNSDVDKLYINRTKGGRGLKRIKTLFESRIISIYQHLQLNCQCNEILQYINECETDTTKRVAEELLRVSGINTETNEKPKL